MNSSVSIPNVLVLDTESNGLDLRWDPKAKVTGISYCSDRITPQYLAVGHMHDNTHTVEEAAGLICGVIPEYDAVVAHNMKYDLIALRSVGIEVGKFYDTMLMAHWINENWPNKSLDWLGNELLGEKKVHDPLMESIINSLGWGFIPVDVISPYAKQDVALTHKLFKYLYPLFQAEGFDE